MRAHSYSHMCGCHACCVHEARMERDAALREEYRWALAECPDFITEQAIGDEFALAAVKAIKDGDDAELGRIYREAVMASADWHIDHRANSEKMTPGEAARQLFDIYRPNEGRKAA